MVEKMKANIFYVAGCIALALFVSGASGANRAVASGSVCADEPETIIASAMHPCHPEVSGLHLLIPGYGLLIVSLVS
jgi:hypothetical protein